MNMAAEENTKENFNKNMDAIAVDLAKNSQIAPQDKAQLQQEGKDLKLRMNGATSKDTNIEKKELLDSFGEWLTKIKDFISSDKLQKIAQSVLNFANKILEASAEITTSIRDFMKTLKESEKDKGIDSTLKNIDVGMHTLHNITEGIKGTTDAVGTLINDVKQSLRANQPDALSAKHDQSQVANLDLQKLATAAGKGLRDNNAKLVKDDVTINKSALPIAARTQERSVGR